MLHIHNGDCSANTAKKSNIPGEHLAWREALICGPVIKGLTEAEWRTLRARHLAEAYGLKFDDCEKNLREQQETLSRCSDHEEVVLWFDHDLFCQLHLIYLLDWFARQELGTARLSLICVGSFPGIDDFQGLGQLNSEQMASLLPERQQVTAAELKLAAKAWAAFSSTNPREIAALLADDSSALPFLQPALRKHLERFPSAQNGLGLIENKALELIAHGASQFEPLFQEFGKAEPTYGLGDAQFWLMLRQVADAAQPLLRISNGDGLMRSSSSDFIKTSFALTKTGQSVSRGDDDFIALNGIDTWLGGVHLQGKEVWRWDEKQEELIPKVGV
ncbi:MAG: RNA polymerase subunit sigma-24 [Pyrinomonadaceae bacterium]